MKATTVQDRARGDAGPTAPERRREDRKARKPRRETIEVRRPRDGSPIGEVSRTEPARVLEAVERARAVQHRWVGLDPEDRFQRLRGLIRVLGEASEEIGDIVQEETGKPRVEALTEVLVSLELLKYYAENIPRVLRRQFERTSWWLAGKSAYTYREPYGVIGAITPWNYPFIIPMDIVAGALFTGNAVVLKPSEHTPFSALKIRDLLRDTEVPAGLLEVVTGDGTTGEALVESGVDKVFFTGRSVTGRKVMASAAESLTPVALALGGKDPALVLEDADLDRAARGVVYGAFFNAGQTCISTERCFVVEEVFDEFVERVREQTEELRVGDTGEYEVGPMITERQIEVVEDHIEDALARGARVLTGGGRLDPGSRLMEPTVLVDVDASMKVLWEETFGPVLPIVEVRDEDEAIRMANMSPFGLFASIWTDDRERGEALAERIHAGGVSINDTLSHYAVPGLPLGGTGESGFGRRRGLAGLEEMTRPRSVLVHRTGLARDQWWFPYKGTGLRLVRSLLEFRQATNPLTRFWNGVVQLFRRQNQ